MKKQYHHLEGQLRHPPGRVRHAVLQPHAVLAQIVKDAIGLIPSLAGAEVLQRMISEQSSCSSSARASSSSSPQPRRASVQRNGATERQHEGHANAIPDDSKQLSPVANEQAIGRTSSGNSSGVITQGQS
jgi:hypothetical protein